MATRNYRETTAALVGDSTLKERAYGFLVIHSGVIVAEAGGVANHANRLTMALAIQSDPAVRDKLAERLAIYLVQNATIRGKVAAGTLSDDDDSDIEFVAVTNSEAVVNALATAYAAEVV